MSKSVSNNNPMIFNNASVKNIGLSNLIITGNELIINSNITNYHFKESINNIDFLVFSNGNLIWKDKIFIGINSIIFEISCEDNDNSLRDFYYNIVRSKEMGIPSNYNSNSSSSETNQLPDKKYDEIRNLYDQMKKGIISEEEFEKEKAILLEKINKSKEGDEL
jgi:hypothetical protein